MSIEIEDAAKTIRLTRTIINTARPLRLARVHARLNLKPDETVASHLSFFGEDTPGQYMIAKSITKAFRREEHLDNPDLYRIRRAYTNDWDIMVDYWRSPATDEDDDIYQCWMGFDGIMTREIALKLDNFVHEAVDAGESYNLMTTLRARALDALRERLEKSDIDALAEFAMSLVDNYYGPVNLRDIIRHLPLELRNFATWETQEYMRRSIRRILASREPWDSANPQKYEYVDLDLDKVDWDQVSDFYFR